MGCLLKIASIVCWTLFLPPCFRFLSHSPPLQDTFSWAHRARLLFPDKSCLMETHQGGLIFLIGYQERPDSEKVGRSTSEKMSSHFKMNTWWGILFPATRMCGQY